MQPVQDMNMEEMAANFKKLQEEQARLYKMMETMQNMMKERGVTVAAPPPGGQMGAAITSIKSEHSQQRTAPQNTSSAPLHSINPDTPFTQCAKSQDSEPLPETHHPGRNQFGATIQQGASSASQKISPELVYVYQQPDAS